MGDENMIFFHLYTHSAIVNAIYKWTLQISFNKFPAKSKWYPFHFVNFNQSDFVCLFFFFKPPARSVLILSLTGWSGFQKRKKKKGCCKSPAFFLVSWSDYCQGGDKLLRLKCWNSSVSARVFVKALRRLAFKKLCSLVGFVSFQFDSLSIALQCSLSLKSCMHL